MQKPKRGGGQPKLINAERAVEWKNVRLCSPMFAYVRLIGKKSEKPNGERPEATEDTEVTEDAVFGENDGDREDASTLRSRATAEDGLPRGLGNRPIQGAAHGHLGAAHGH